MSVKEEDNYHITGSWILGFFTKLPNGNDMSGAPTKNVLRNILQHVSMDQVGNRFGADLMRNVSADILITTISTPKNCNCSLILREKVDVDTPAPGNFSSGVL